MVERGEGEGGQAGVGGEASGAAGATGEGEASANLRVEELPPSWFGRAEYRPRLPAGETSRWFILDPAFAPARHVPAEAPLEPPEGRARLRHAFEESYRGWAIEWTTETRRALDHLSEEGTAVVATGQQPGFLGGPLYNLYKALSTIAAARAYRAMSGRRCVPVFWVAGEDHDLDEVRSARFPAAEGGGVSFSYPHPAERKPLADCPMDEAACAVLDAAAAHLGTRRHAAEARRLIDLYRGRTLAGGFAALLDALLGRLGLLFVDPSSLRPLASRIFQQVVDRPEDILACIERGRKDVRARGLEPFVSGRFPLFVVQDGRRHHLALTPSGLAIDGGGDALPREQILRMARESIASLSAGALLRPLIQQATLPCVLAIGGPAEVGYYGQLGPLADYLGVRRPVVGLRLGATIVDGKLARRARDIPLATIAAATGPGDLVEKDPEHPALRAVRDLAAGAESTLLRAVKEVAGPEESARLRARAVDLPGEIRKFADRLDKVLLSRRKVELDLGTRLWEFILPDGTLQERCWSPLHFVARHGTGWIESLLDAIEPDPLRVAHRWITFGEEP